MVPPFVLLRKDHVPANAEMRRRKANLNNGPWNPKRKFVVTSHFIDIIKRSSGEKGPTLNKFESFFELSLHPTFVLDTNSSS